MCGEGGGGLGGAFGGGPGGSVGGVQVGRFGLGWGGGYMPPTPGVGQSQAPLTSPCPPSTHTITFSVSWFSYANQI